jgi:hypothetical protein
MKISLIVEGKTETAFVPHLRRFLQTRLLNRMPRIDASPYDGHIPTGDKLKRRVEALLNDGVRSADAVIALTDVYTGSREFVDANDAKSKMRTWVADNRFYPHAAQHDFEAWLIPYWPDIKRLAGSNRTSPGPTPENIDHDKPPSYWIAEVFRSGSHGKAYVKPRDANRILRDKDLLVAAYVCSELKAFLNTILSLCNSPTI